MAGYGTDGGFATWLTAYGYSLPAGASAPAILRERGSGYIDALYGGQYPAPRFSGTPTAPLTQERAWPRTGATVHGAVIPSDAIPDAVVRASYFAAYQEALKPGSLSVVATASRQVKRVKAGSTEVEFTSGDGDALSNATPILSSVAGLLAPYLVGQAPAVPLGILSIGGPTCG